MKKSVTDSLGFEDLRLLKKTYNEILKQSKIDVGGVEFGFILHFSR